MNSGDMNLGRLAGRALDQINTFVKKTNKIESEPTSFTEKLPNSGKTSQELQQKPTEFKSDSKEFVKSHLEPAIGVTLLTTGTLASVALLPLVGLGAIGGGLIGGTVKQLGQLLPDGSSLKEHTKNADRLGVVLGMTIGSLGTVGMALAGLKMLEKEAPIKPQMETISKPENESADKTQDKTMDSVIVDAYKAQIEEKKKSLDGDLGLEEREIVESQIKNLEAALIELEGGKSLPKPKAEEPKWMRPEVKARRKAQKEDLEKLISLHQELQIDENELEMLNSMKAPIYEESVSDEVVEELAAKNESADKPQDKTTSALVNAFEGKDQLLNKDRPIAEQEAFATLLNQLKEIQNKLKTFDLSNIDLTDEQVVNEVAVLQLQKEKLEELISLHEELQTNQNELHMFNTQIDEIDEGSVDDHVVEGLAKQGNELENKIEGTKEQIAKLEKEIEDLKR